MRRFAFSLLLSLAPISLSATTASARPYHHELQPIFVGAQVQVAWGASWYPATVLAVSGGDYLIRYNGWSSAWDEWVDASRIQGIAPAVAVRPVESSWVFWGGEWRMARVLEHRDGWYRVECDGWGGTWQWVDADLYRTGRRPAHAERPRRYDAYGRDRWHHGYRPERPSFARPQPGRGWDDDHGRPTRPGQGWDDGGGRPTRPGQGWDDGGGRPTRPGQGSQDEGRPTRPGQGSQDEGRPTRPGQGSQDEGRPTRPGQGSQDEGRPTRPGQGSQDEGRPTRPGQGSQDEGRPTRPGQGSQDEGRPTRPSGERPQGDRPEGGHARPPQGGQGGTATPGERPGQGDGARPNRPGQGGQGGQGGANGQGTRPGSARPEAPSGGQAARPGR